MIVKLHKNARTTPAIRAQLAASNEPVAVLAKRFNLAPNTVRKWQARTDFNDRSHTAHNLQTTLSEARHVRCTKMSERDAIKHNVSRADYRAFRG